jgi:hypothetical protein
MFNFQCTNFYTCIVPLLALGISLLGLFISFSVWRLAHRVLRADHDWRRRQYALAIVSEWNDKLIPNIRIVETKFPSIRENNNAPINVEVARELYMTNANKAEYELNFAVRAAIISILNYFEYIALAYTNGVADRKIIDQSLRASMMKWYEKLKDFENGVAIESGVNPWLPLHNLMISWEAEPLVMRSPTA